MATDSNPCFLLLLGPISEGCQCDHFTKRKPKSLQNWNPNSSQRLGVEALPTELIYWMFKNRHPEVAIWLIKA
ncbi:unnamed protein product [Arabidopsis thaliana]|uniref:Uncharacterized protein n=2 Tax=Arabidopsis thaliana TaxID=3702 RepID=A0A654FUH9_ARATH|nr:uncharacterized protein AT4G31073 [Arabidopsis thaliana]ANM67010.1 hypothetical protein AT4G31073 [Arabidopsis thaliana]CAA0397089.1 unnamed protein product [Arabidopsis thaliana]VYS64500.1 unnamed protein product [Arabidopsis thaliana]|eukprot:NP_001328867.1 hypothetical protein AT4G31073 [Arabidopsis thaliana]